MGSIIQQLHRNAKITHELIKHEYAGIVIRETMHFRMDETAALAHDNMWEYSQHNGAYKILLKCIEANASRSNWTGRFARKFIEEGNLPTLGRCDARLRRTINGALRRHGDEQQATEFEARAYE